MVFDIVYTNSTMPSTQFAFKEKYRYQNGFNSYHEYACYYSTVTTCTDAP
jgi:homogentisate 1,2-dioxygenase